MKAGRPSYHIRAKWITVATPQGLVYFELDRKGNLIGKNIAAHHVLPVTQTRPDPPPEVVTQSTPLRIETPVFTDYDFFGDMDFDVDLLS
jgi:hypothetical protein